MIGTRARVATVGYHLGGCLDAADRAAYLADLIDEAMRWTAANVSPAEGASLAPVLAAVRAHADRVSGEPAPHRRAVDGDR